MIATVLVALALGLIVGSFLNVCIHRLPLRESIVWPASRCPHCRSAIAPGDNIPVIGYLRLRGRCRTCGSPISVQYPLVEVTTAAIFVGSVLLVEPPLLYARLAFACAMIVLFVIDLEHRILPDVITLPGIVLGLVLSFFLPPGWRDSAIGLVAGGGVLWLVGELYFRVRGEEGMGFGDVKMLAMIGAFLGWKLMILTLMLASLVGSVVGVGMIALKLGDMKYALPFGTFLAVGALFAAAVGDPIVTWYTSLYF